MYKNSFQIVHSRSATEALSIARKNGMTMRVLGKGDVPLVSYYQDEWWFEPVTPESTIPPEGLRRIQVLTRAKVPIKGLVIAHEAPRLLPAPQIEPSEHQSVRRQSTMEFDLESILAVLSAVCGAFFMLFGIAFVVALRLDPVLIAVLSDDTWIEVMTWYD